MTRQHRLISAICRVGIFKILNIFIKENCFTHQSRVSLNISRAPLLRWYVMSGKVDKAIDMLKKFAKVNGKEVKQEIFDEFEKSCKSMMETDKSYNQYTVVHLFKMPRLARITVMLIIYW